MCTYMCLCSRMNRELKSSPLAVFAKSSWYSIASGRLDSFVPSCFSLPVPLTLISICVWLCAEQANNWITAFENSQEAWSFEDWFVEDGVSFRPDGCWIFQFFSAIVKPMGIPSGFQRFLTPVCRSRTETLNVQNNPSIDRYNNARSFERYPIRC